MGQTCDQSLVLSIIDSWVSYPCRSSAHAAFCGRTGTRLSLLFQLDNTCKRYFDVKVSR